MFRSQEIEIYKMLDSSKKLNRVFYVELEMESSHGTRRDGRKIPESIQFSILSSL